jgi:predicted alpha/beta superfamily hydrolase
MMLRRKTVLLVISGLFFMIISSRGGFIPGSPGNEGLAQAQNVRTEYPRVEIRDTERRSLVSERVGRKFEVDVFLPVDYRKTENRYPVVYVLDAEYNFGCVAYIARRLIKNKDIPPILLVGIAYDTTYEDFYEKRMFDSTPVSKVHGYHTGGAEPFTEFVADELIPFVDREYRTIPGDRTIVGHSITGFYGCYLLFENPEIFQKYLVVSPSLWFSNRVIFDYEKEYSKKNPSLRTAVYLASGSLETPNIKDNSAEFGGILEARQYQGMRLKSVIMEGEHHRSIFPLAFTRGLQFLFGRDPR